MSINNRPNLLAAVALAAASFMGGMGQSAEVVPRPSGLGGWLRKKNRVPRVKDTKSPRSQLNRRLRPASGHGSYNEWKAALAAERAAKRAVHDSSGELTK